MASQAVNLLRSPDKLDELGRLTKQHADRWFDMPNYIHELIKLAATSQKEVLEPAFAYQDPPV